MYRVFVYNVVLYCVNIEHNLQKTITNLGVLIISEKQYLSKIQFVTKNYY